MDDDVQEAVLELDRRITAAAEQIELCGQLVNEGRLDGNVVFVKVNELAARLMGGGAPAAPGQT